MDDGKTILHGKYEIGKILGQGTFGKVYLARELRTETNVAMKVVGKEMVMKVGMTEQIKREISVMKMVRHPNIVDLHEVMASKTKIYFAMELVRGGELFCKVSRNGRLKEEEVRSYFRQLISAVDFCHSRGVYHRDLKLENLLLDEMGNLKIADFGLTAFADHLRPDGLLHTTCGTPAYVAPEIIQKKGYHGAKVDVWSCGVILYALLAGFLPFQDGNLMNMYKKINRGDFKCPPWFSTESRRLITKLLDPNPNTRITIAKLIETPWFRKSSSRRSQEEPSVEVNDKSRWGKDKPKCLNAFHIISLSEGFDLSPLFEDGRREEEEMRFATREPVSGVISRLEGVAAKSAGKFKLMKSENGVRLEGSERGRKGRLTIAAEIFLVAPSVLVVEVKKDGGDALEYRSFCSNELQPALKDIVWASSESQATAV